IKKQKQVTNHVFEPTAFFANMNKKGGNSGRRDVKNGKNDSRYEVKRLCTHCNQEGRIVDQCFEKIGYPDWYKGKKAKKSTRMATHVNSGFDEHFHDDTPFDTGSENKVGFGQNSGDPSTKEIIVVGKSSRCLYICKPTIDQVAFFNSVFEFSNSHKKFSPTVCFNKNAYSNYVYKQSVDVHTFHARLGHTFVSNLIHIPICNSMDLSKFSCPYKQSALNGAHYFFTIVDDHTRATRTYLVHTKNQILVVITSFLAYVETHFQNKPEFISLLLHKPIIQTPPVTNTPEPIPHNPRDPNIPTQLPIVANPVSNNEGAPTRRPSRYSTDFKGIPQSHSGFLENAFATSDPTTFHQASSDSGWIEAINKELAASESNNTWTLTSLPSGHIPISSKWVYKTKYHPDGSGERKKGKISGERF
nr:hypothetical protein [Tanacetum cinerariifolium]GFA17242.1 hypothetical protein [Tanacetum cinerariifolium]GFA30262.1 hypothetical protein [Tanacetum cinerariifolium]